MGNMAIRVEHLSKKYEIVTGKSRGESGLAERVTHGVRRMLGMGEVTESSSPRREVVWPVRDVSFEVQCGEIVGIVGRNGAGKSTLLKILSRITEPTSGRAQIYGRVGTLLEVGTGFHPELTGRDNIYLSGIIYGMTKQEIDNRFDEIVAFSGVEKYIDTPVKRYSSGMYVRLAFAVGAHMDCEVLIVDEVLAVGDTQFQKKCLDKMLDMGRDGRTVVFISHDMDAVTKLCKRVILLEEGKVVADGSAHDVVGKYIHVGPYARSSKEWADLSTAPGNDVARLTKIPGIGRKTAERLVLELRDKLPAPGEDAPSAIPSLTAVQEDVLSALVNLGYQRTVAEKALISVAKDGSFDAMFRGALAAMNK